MIRTGKLLGVAIVLSSMIVADAEARRGGRGGFHGGRKAFRAAGFHHRGFARARNFRAARPVAYRPRAFRRGFARPYAFRRAAAYRPRTFRRGVAYRPHAYRRAFAYRRAAAYRPRAYKRALAHRRAVAYRRAVAWQIRARQREKWRERNEERWEKWRERQEELRDEWRERRKDWRWRSRPAYFTNYNYYYGGRPYYYTPPRAYTYALAGSGSVAAVQRRLAREGYYGGAIDGIMGPRTRSAIVRFARDHGLPATAAITRPLLVSLGLA